MSNDTPNESVSIKPESIKYMGVVEDRIGYTLTLQFDGGGVSLYISKTNNSKTIADKFRHLSEMIELSVDERAT